MFGQLGIGEILMVAFVGLVVLGPERLPKYAKEAGRMLRNLRNMATAATEDLKAEMGPEVANLDVRDLHPRAMMRKFMEEDEIPEPAKPDEHAHLTWTNPTLVDNTVKDPTLAGGFDDVT